MKKALIFDPYLNTLGGGEFYTLSVVNFLLKKDFQVDLAWDKVKIFEKIYQRFNINLKNRVKISKKAYQIFTNKKYLLKKLKFTGNYNIIFYVSDGSIPILLGKKNFLHFQVPFIGVKGKSLANQVKLKKIDKIICNSKFTAKHIKQEFKLDPEIIYPPLSEKFARIKKIKKENIILSVGRFDQILNAKRQDVLIKIFKKMVSEGLKKWQLVLLGGLLDKKNDYFGKLKSGIDGFPIKIFTNVSFDNLLKYYQKAKIFWHAAGFDQNLKKYPQKAEHFGISTVEAMASGCVPIVFNGGGLPEIVDDKKNGFLWNRPEELEKITSNLIVNSEKRIKIAKKAVMKSKEFGLKNFEKKLERMLEDV